MWLRFKLTIEDPIESRKMGLSMPVIFKDTLVSLNDITDSGRTFSSVIVKLITIFTVLMNSEICRILKIVRSKSKLSS